MLFFSFRKSGVGSQLTPPMPLKSMFDILRDSDCSSCPKKRRQMQIVQKK